MPTEQQLFDKIVSGLRAQGEPSVDEDGMCAYRGTGGCKCAAGQVIPDDDYRPWMDDHGTLHEVLRHCGLSDHYLFIQAMQALHDEIWVDRGTPEFVESLQAFAAACNLNAQVADDWSAAL